MDELHHEPRRSDIVSRILFSDTQQVVRKQRTCNMAFIDIDLAPKEFLSTYQ